MTASILAERLEHPMRSWAPELGWPDGDVVRVADVAALFAAIETATPGQTIAIADGHYMLPRVLTVQTDRVTVRSESGERDRVILDGADSADGELFGFTECHGATVADLTIQNIMWNGFKLNGNIGRSVRDITVRNCVIHNIWQRGIKSVSGPEADDDSGLPLRPGDPKQAPRRRHFVDGCRVEYCLFYNDRAKAFADDSYEVENPDKFGGNYIAGMDVMSARGWTVSDNVLMGIRGRTGGARGAIFFWQGSQDVTIERNAVVDCDSGMWLGLAFPPEDVRQCVRYRVVGNLISRPRCAGLLLNRHVDGLVSGNTIEDPVPAGDRLAGTDIDDGGVLCEVAQPRCRPLRIGLGNNELRISDNIWSGPEDAHVSENAGSVELRGNQWLRSGEGAPADWAQDSGAD